MFAGAAHANSLADKILGQFEASLNGCAAVRPGDPQRRVIEDDIERFVKLPSVPDGLRFEVRDCLQDGFVYQGHTIVISSRLAARPAAQRFFIMAHELGHLQLRHHGAVSNFVAQTVGSTADEGSARALLTPGLTAMSHRHELEADAFAVRLMREAGLDPADAARLFDSIGGERDNATHPSPLRRAREIRALAAKKR